MTETPVLFIVFNRPELTKIVLDKIKLAQPKFLFVAADGPRKHVEGEFERCEQVREMIAASVTWDCELKLNYRQQNLGCKVGPSSAIDWFFDHVECGIILEDDCVPDLTFFDYCRELLDRYQTAKKVMMISGASFQEKPLDSASYYFSTYAHIWGWATWKDRWALYDVEMATIDEHNVKEILKKNFRIERERTKWLQHFFEIKNGIVTTAWDTQWMFTIWKNQGMSVVPWKNMITNIGYGPGATNTVMAESPEANLPAFALIKIIHPKKVAINAKADRKIRFAKSVTPNIERIKRRLINIFSFGK